MSLDNHFWQRSFDLYYSFTSIHSPTLVVPSFVCPASGIVNDECVSAMFCLPRRPVLSSAQYVLSLAHPIVGHGANLVAEHSQCQGYLHDESIPCPERVIYFLFVCHISRALQAAASSPPPAITCCSICCGVICVTSIYFSMSTSHILTQYVRVT